MSAEPLLVSTVIPVHNGARFLGEAIASIRRQGRDPLEIVVVDDGSTDDTAALVQDLGGDIRLFVQENRGPAAARNRGLAMARGEVIAFLDADDVWPERKLALQMARLEADPGLDIVLGRVRCFGDLERVEGKIRFEGPDHTMINVNLGSGVYRRRVFDKVGLFDDDLRSHEDHDWFLRAREGAVPMTILREVTLLYRLHEHNMSRDSCSGAADMVRILKKSLDRRRARDDGGALPLPLFFDFGESGRDPKGTES